MIAEATTNLFLSKLILDPRSRQVMSELAHPYEMHRTLLRAFPEVTDESQAKARDKYGVLFRAEVDDRHETVKLLVQSRIKPEWSFLDGLRGYLSNDTPEPVSKPKDITPLLQNINRGHALAFRLRANPTKRIKNENGPWHGKRVELRREDEQVDWLMRKGRERIHGVPGGFALPMRKVWDADGKEHLVPDVRVYYEGKQTGRKKDAGFPHSTVHLAVVFEGVLEVTCAEHLISTIASGIGSAKAFGFGLLSVAPVPAVG